LKSLPASGCSGFVVSSNWQRSAALRQ
jgi:hypothetical protein